MKKNDGFSLIELLIAIFFISIVLVAIASGMMKVAQALWETKARAIAVNMAQNCIEDINFANKHMSWYNFFSDGSAFENNCQERAGLVVASGATDFAVATPDSNFLCNENPDGNVTGCSILGNMKRTFMDDSIQTRFNFHVVAYKATQEYNRLGTGSPVIRSQAVVVVTTVTWEKYYNNGSSAAKNTYTVTKQYLQPSTY